MDVTEVKNQTDRINEVLNGVDCILDNTCILDFEKMKIYELRNAPFVEVLNTYNRKNGYKMIKIGKGDKRD
ncbi:hypothetical protein [Clostridium sp. HBUAS56010]|uniref:hypothetical protein n=1 Tax=Clostridium sp. HBUAS56010 TaxID=2571127 RepID=UPI001177A7C3|nr:hypothetical protein [Clostridium sp. HBUAS56010]